MANVGNMSPNCFRTLPGTSMTSVFLKGMHTDGVAHGPATLFLHTGSINLVRPSVGSWVLYGLGSENDNLPGFVTIQPSMGNGGPRNYQQCFSAGGLPRHRDWPSWHGGERGQDSQPQQLTLDASPTAATVGIAAKAQCSRKCIKRPGDTELEAVINSYELAWRMQQSVPDILDLSQEPQHVHKLYGIGIKTDRRFWTAVLDGTTSL